MMSTNIPNIIPFLFFLSILLANTKFVGRFFCMSNLIIGLYTFSAFSHFFIATFYNPQKECSLEAFLLVFITITILVMPLSMFERKCSKTFLKQINENKLLIAETTICIICFFSILFFSQYIAQVFSNGIVETRNSKSTLYESGIPSKTAVMGAFLSPTALFFFFYNKIQKINFRKLNIALPICSLSFIFYTLNVAGRDGIVIWGLTFLALYTLFYKHLSDSDKKSINKIIFFAFILFIPILIFISTSRFEDSDHGTTISMLNYIGQGLDNLTYNIGVYKYREQSSGNLLGTFPVLEPLASLFGYESNLATDTFGKMDVNLALGYRANQFSYFIGSIYPSNFSIYVLFAFIAIIIFVCKFSLILKNNVISTPHLLIAFTWYMIPIVGVFYFYYGSLIGNVFLLVPFLLFWWLK